MRKLSQILALTLVFPLTIFAQSDDKFDLELLIEDFFNLQELNINYEDLYESLLLLYQNPLNINNATPDELRNTYVLSEQQIQNLRTYIEEKGKLVTLFELQVIDGFDFQTIQKLIPFITINSEDFNSDDRPLLERILTETNNHLITRFERTLEEKRGYTPPSDPDDTRYTGSPDKIYLRYRVSRPGDFSFGFTTEKDPGEAIIWDPETKRYGMDYWSAHAMLENQGKFRRVIVGDYQLQLGQGLLLGAGFNVGKGAETINTVQRVSLGIRPYTSVLESGFLRGVAGTYKVDDKLSLTGFLSSLNQDANIRTGQGENGFEEVFSSIQTSGLHRTPTEIENKRSINEKVAGLNVEFRPSPLFNLGGTFLINRFDVPILRSDEPYNRFEFSGTNNINVGLYSNYSWRGFSFFGETAISKSGGVGGIVGFTKDLTSRFEFALIFRHFDRDFHSFRGTAFSESSRNINEKGVYWGIKYTFDRKFFLTAYYDSFRFPWLKFRVNNPSNGNDYLIRLNYNPGRGVRIYGQFRREIKEVNHPGQDLSQVIIIPGKKNQIIANVDFNAAPGLRLKSRVQWSNYTIDTRTTDGVAFIQDANYTIGNWSISSRIAFFDTEGNENRQYAYERDVLYAFSIPAYSGRGIRNYFLVSYKLNRKMDVWARIARTTFYDRDQIGTGLETIDGDQRTEIKFQVRYGFN